MSNTLKVELVGANWCSQCGPLKDALTLSGIEFTYLDADREENIQRLNEWGVRTLPTTIITKDDGTVTVITGNKLKDIVEVLQ